MLYCFNLYWLITLCLLHMHFKLFAYNDHIVLLFSEYTCPYGSRVSHILELGMSEFCSIVPNSHVKSRACSWVLSWNSQRGRLYGWIYSIILLALFHAKFACNSAFRNPIFMWESCKGSVWESVKKSSRVCTSRNWILRLARDWQIAKGGTRVKHAGELKSHASCCTTGQSFQSGQVVSSRFKLAMRSNCEAESLEHPVC